MSARVVVQAERGRERLIGIGLVLISGISFSVLPIFNRYAAAAGVNVTTLLALRFSIAAAVVWMMLSRSGRAVAGRSLSRRRIAGLCLLGAIYVAQSSSFFESSRRIPVALTSILLYLYPAVVALLAWLFLGDRLTGIKLFSLTLALAGSVLTLGSPQAGTDILGVVLGIVSAIIYSIYIVLGSRLQIGVPVRVASAYIMTAAGLIFIVFGLVTGQLNLALSSAAYVPVLGLALISTVVPFLTFFAGMERIGPSHTSIISAVEPLGTAVLGALLLGEMLGPLQLIGGGLILSAVVLLALRGER